MLYPLKFKSIYKEKVWGGNKLKTILNKKDITSNKTGESWEISACENDISLINNGELAGKSLTQIVETEKSKLVGEKIYSKYGNKFPLLIKFIDANDDLSVQVHPNDNIAQKNHNLNGKTEMWYIVEADKNSKIIAGLNRDSSKKEYFNLLGKKEIKNILNFETGKAGDVFFIPSGRIHAICKGVLLAEIQQTSDLTYRIYDWDRAGTDGKPRELHTKLAAEAIDYKKKERYKTDYFAKINKSCNLNVCEYFTVNLLEFDKIIQKDYSGLDSFVIYMCVEGQFDIDYGNGTVNVKKGETVLIPAELKNIKLITYKKAKLLEIYI